MILAVALRITVFSAPVPKRVIRAVLFLFAASIPALAVTAL
jgi:hypothetical protein